MPRPRPHEFPRRSQSERCGAVIFELCMSAFASPYDRLPKRRVPRRSGLRLPSLDGRIAADSKKEHHLVVRPYAKLRQLRDIHRDPPRFARASSLAVSMSRGQTPDPGRKQSMRVSGVTRHGQIRECHRHAVGLCAESCCSNPGITLANRLFRSLRFMQINVSRRL
jgi:hypothetical protein